CSGVRGLADPSVLTNILTSGTIVSLTGSIPVVCVLLLLFAMVSVAADCRCFPDVNGCGPPSSAGGGGAGGSTPTSPPAPSPTTSRYMMTEDIGVAYNLGKTQALAGETGLLVLDYGRGELRGTS